MGPPPMTATSGWLCWGFIAKLLCRAVYISKEANKKYEATSQSVKKIGLSSVKEPVQERFNSDLNQVQSMTRKVIISFLVTLLLLNLAFFSTQPIITSASPTVIGVLDQDATWTKADSPYTLTGPVAVSKGVTLTIQPGTVVNFNSFYIQVNGTLIAKGTGTEPITFSNGSITFTAVSNGWNEQTGSGSIIENALFNTASVDSAAPLKFNQNTVKGNVAASGSSLVSGNDITGSVSAKDSTIISGNTIKGGVTANGPVNIYNNTITGLGSIFSAIVVVYIVNDNANTPLSFSGNTIDGGPQAPGKGSNVGLQGSGNIAIISNYFYDCAPAIRGSIGGTIQRNYFAESSGGIDAIATAIQNNTFTGDTSIYVEGSPAISYNNFLGTGGITVSSSNNLDAAYNWWGTTETASIDQKIRDYNDDFNLGKVVYTPFLTEKNPQAMPDQTGIVSPSQPTSSPAMTEQPTNPPAQASSSPSLNPSESPSQTGTSSLLGLSWEQVVIIILALTVAVLVTLQVLQWKRKKAI